MVEKVKKQGLTDEERAMLQFRKRFARDAVNSITALYGWCQDEMFWEKIKPVRTYMQYFESRGYDVKMRKKILAETNKRKLEDFNETILEINDLVRKGVKEQEQADKIISLVEKVIALIDR